MQDKLIISEVFYSIQGEGITTGCPSYFIRTGGCNLMCGGFGTEKDKQMYNGATWRCDTIEVWRKGKRYSFDELFNKLGNKFIDNIKAGAHVIFTGGEPLMQEEQIINFLTYLFKKDIRPFVEIESNGTIAPLIRTTQIVDQWNISPKLSNSGMPKEKRINSLALMLFDFCANAIFKFVISRESDWIEIEDDYLSFINRKDIVLMPAASSIDELKQNSILVAEICKRECVRMCSRLHISIWNQLTGV